MGRPVGPRRIFPGRRPVFRTGRRPLDVELQRPYERPVTIGKDDLRIGLFLGWRTFGRNSSLNFVFQSLIREFSRILPGQTVVLYNASLKRFMEKVEGLDKVTGHRLKRLEDICSYGREFDVLYTPYWWSGIGTLGVPQVHFIPDVNPVIHPHHEKKIYAESFVLACKYGIGISKYIITPSAHTKKTLIDQFGLAEERIRVVCHGVHRIFSDTSNGGSRPPDMSQTVADYLFFPATQLQRKNHKTLLDALVLLRERYALEPCCVFAGDLDCNSFNVDVRAEILRRKLSKTVHHLGMVSLDELKYLYVNAKGLIFPSFFEGFGLPVLEAMTSGCPVLASNRTSVPEVAGEAALYFDPCDPGDIAETIFGFYKDSSIAKRLVDAGKKRAENFSNVRQALETRDVLFDAYLAANGDLRKRPRILVEFDKLPPLVTIILVWQRSTYMETLQELVALKKDVGRIIEVISIVSHREAQLLEALCADDRRIRYETDLHNAIADAVHQAAGTFIFFSTGDALPAPSFLFFLAEEGHTLKGDFLHGEVYFKDKRTGGIRSSADFQWIRDELERDYCAHYLPFVVRREAVASALSNAESPPGSLPDLVMLLFDTCKRRRLFFPVSVKSARVRPYEIPYSVIFLSRIERKFVHRRLLFRALNHPAVRYWTLRLLDAYVVLPEWVAAVVRVIAKPVWNRLHME
jgi:glycosyltransferase involved in cell wall biosynthesis